MEKFVPESVKDSYIPTNADLFLWWLSTAEPELLSQAVVDRNRHRIVGMTVLTTWMFATFAWTYFFSTVVPQPWLYVSCGIFMGFVILVIDRALIKGINRFNKKKAFPLLFRSFLALTIGTFMAQPAVLFIFKKDIQTQLAFDNQDRIQRNREKTDTIFYKQANDLLNRKKDLRNELDKKSAEVSEARNNFLAETDGSGGTGRVGIREIALAKKAEYEKLNKEFLEISERNLPAIRGLDSSLTSIDSEKKKAAINFEAAMEDGFLTKVESMNNLMKQNTALQWRYYLIVFILMLIELMPVIAKTMLPSGTYDEMAKLKEEMEIALARKNIEREFELKDEYHRVSLSSDLEKLRENFRKQ